MTDDTNGKNNLDDYYRDTDSRINTIIGDNSELWSKISRAGKQFQNESGSAYSIEKFSRWLSDNYGIRLAYGSEMISMEAEIVDEQKLTIFLLKY